MHSSNWRSRGPDDAGEGETYARADGRRRPPRNASVRGPPGGDRGPVIGFLLTDADALETSTSRAIYMSGDTVWYEGVEEVARHADVRVAIIFLGAARVREVGPSHLTFTAEEGVLVARAMPNALIVPVHYEGWAHFSEGRAVIQRAFDDAGLSARLRWLEPGRPTPIR